MPATPTVLAGTVRDDAGNPVPNARVYITSGPGPVPDIAALTDGEGRFVLTAPAAGTYVIEGAADGFASSSTTVEVAGEPELHPELRLTPAQPRRP